MLQNPTNHGLHPRPGLWNSSRTRVAPVFRAIEALPEQSSRPARAEGAAQAEPPADREDCALRGEPDSRDEPFWPPAPWPPPKPLLDLLDALDTPRARRLLRCPETLGSWPPARLRYDGNPDGDGELALDPPASLLHWLVDALAYGRLDVSERALAREPQQRRLLAGGDAATRAAAHAWIDAAERGAHAAPLFPRHWAVLEGPSCPDVFLETEAAVFVVEGKRTERGPTRSTRWMACRDQLLRHMDAALEYVRRRGLIKPVYGFYIVEGDHARDPLRVPSRWQAMVDQTTERHVLVPSLPHRSDADRRLLARGYLGATTWTAVVRRFGLHEDDVLPVMVAPPGTPGDPSGEPPELLRFSSGGFPDGHHGIEIRRDPQPAPGCARHDDSDSASLPARLGGTWRIATLEPPRRLPEPADAARRWRRFYRLLEELDVWNWRETYENAGILDGSQWELEIVCGGRRVRSYGSNAWPGETPGDGHSHHAFRRLERAIEELIDARLE